MQATVERGLTACAGFRGDSSLSTWLHRIMWNLAVDQSRRDAHELLVDDVEAHWRDDRYSVDPHAVVERSLDADSLREALVRLPFIYRSALVLHDSLGWTHPLIAERLGITEVGSRQRVHRGRLLLVTALADADVRHRLLEGNTMTCWDARVQGSDYLDDELDEAARHAL